MVALRRARNSPAAPEKRSRKLQTRRGLSVFAATGGKQRPVSSRVSGLRYPGFRCPAQLLSGIDFQDKRNGRTGRVLAANTANSPICPFHSLHFSARRGIVDTVELLMRIKSCAGRRKPEYRKPEPWSLQGAVCRPRRQRRLGRAGPGGCGTFLPARPGEFRALRSATRGLCPLDPHHL